MRSTFGAVHLCWYVNKSLNETWPCTEDCHTIENDHNLCIRLREMKLEKGFSGKILLLEEVRHGKHFYHKLIVINLVNWIYRLLSCQL